MGRGTVRVEVRSLNSKQLDLTVKLPAVFRVAESGVRSAAAKVVGRGKADVYVTLENEGGGAAAKINTEVFVDYYRQIGAATEAVGRRGADAAAMVGAILRLPEVLAVEGNGELSEEDTAALMGALEGALRAFDAFRVAEGEVLLADIMGHVGRIEELLGEVEPYECARVGAVKARIMEHISALGIAVDGNRLEQEIVFWVEKLDITEEKVRLAKHCTYFRETASGDDDAGRKLGFIAQEMGREINTLGSKANDAEIQKIVVQMKDELEKVKEQLLNIL